MIKPACILMDIEGTTTSIDFVHEVLFPYSSAKCESFLLEKRQLRAVEECVQDAQALIEKEGGSKVPMEKLGSYFLQWIKDDRKVGPLKKLQGLIWKEGYEQGAYHSHIYDDVKTTWEKWQNSGIKLAIYSSGSVQAQKLLFAHTTAGDLTPFLSAYFDTSIGHKREAASYRKISQELGLEADRILFLSDIPAELNAATDAGMMASHVVRPGTEDVRYPLTTRSFSELAW